MFCNQLVLLINSILISVILPLIHNSIPGGDSGELLAAISPPRSLVFDTFKCLKTEGDSWRKTMMNINKQQELDASSNNKKSTCDGNNNKKSSCGSSLSSFSSLRKRYADLSHDQNNDNNNNEGFICGACFSPSLLSDEDLETETSNCIQPKGAIDSNEGSFSFISSTLPTLMQNSFFDSGIAHPPGYPLYTSLSHFLISLSYEFWRPGAFSTMKMMGNNRTDSTQENINLFQDLRQRVFGSSKTLNHQKETHEFPDKSSSTSTTVPPVETLIFFNSTETIDTEIFLLWDFVIRAHCTSFLYLILACLIIGCSIFRYSYHLMNSRQQSHTFSFMSFATNFLTAATASSMSILTLLASPTVLRYSTEVEVFSLNFVVLALGLATFLHLQQIQVVSNTNDEKESSSLITSYLSVFLSGGVLGLIVIHQHAALFVALPLILGSLVKVFNIIRDSKSGKSALLIFYLVGISGFVISITPNFYQLYIHKCVKQFDSPFGYSWNGKGDSSMIVTSCPVAIWKHLSRDHYGTFSMTNTGEDKNQTSSKTTKQSSKSKSNNNKLVDRFNAHLYWFSSQTPNSIIFMITGCCIHIFVKFIKNIRSNNNNHNNNNNNNSINSDRHLHSLIINGVVWLLLSFFSSIFLFAWFSNFDVSPETTNGKNVFAHVHERFWTQSVVVLSVWSGLCFACAVANYDSSSSSANDNKRQTLFMILAMIVVVFSVSMSSLLNNSVIPRVKSLRQSREACDDCGVTSASISLWWQQQHQQGDSTSSMKTKVLLTSGDLYFGSLIFLDPFMRFFQLQLQQNSGNSPSHHHTHSQFIWLDLEVGSNPWFRRCLLQRRLENLINTYSFFDYESGKNKQKTTNKKLYIQKFRSVENQITAASSNTGRVDILKLVSSPVFNHKSDNFDLFAPELPEFTSKREKLAKLVDFVSSGFVYHLQLKKFIDEQSRSKKVKTVCNTLKRIYEEAEEVAVCDRTVSVKTINTVISNLTISNIFNEDIYDRSITSGLAKSCQNILDSLMMRRKTNSSLPIHLAWVQQTADQCANAAKNSLINLLTHVQSYCGNAALYEESKKGNKAGRPPSSKKKSSLSESESDVTANEECKTKLEKRKQLSSGGAGIWTDRGTKGLYRFLLARLKQKKISPDAKNTLFDMWMNHISLYVKQQKVDGIKDEEKFVAPLVGVLKQLV